MKKTLFIGILCAIFFSNCNNKKEPDSVSKKTIAVAHRGAWKGKKLPGNSIAAFREAVNLECAGSEFDVNMTIDDSLVITHGPFYNKIQIEKATYAELQEFKLKNGEKLPTLNEFIKAGMYNNKTTLFFCEIKPSIISKERGQIISKKIWNVFKKNKALKRVVFISFDYEILKTIVNLDPNAKTQYLNNDRTPDDLESDGISGANFRYPVWQKNPDFIKKAKEKGITLNSGTVNDTIIMDWLLKNDFDYISSDEPALVIRKAAEYNKPQDLNKKN
ncbi:glycerophosphodiester phosphodiesterase family protein [Joostella sp.]|uniref:glycerophosphodiester phosphodiesterase family protein n=1 Tax=Joostella sp. TaxID=2231138 RepID=UPI003A941A70